MSPYFKWDDHSATNSLTVLGSAYIQNRSHKLNNKTKPEFQISDDETSKELSNIIHLAACKSLK